MKKSMLAAIALVVMAGAGFAPVEAAETGTGKYLSAIDAATMMEIGSGEAEIARLLAENSGIDGNQVHFKGMTDRQKIRFLITDNLPGAGKPDKDKAMVHSFQGDRYFNGSDYENAAREYSAAIALAGGTADLFRKRGDSYRQYLAKMKRSPGGRQADARNLMCYGINRDYGRAKTLIDDNQARIDSEINAVRYRMNDMKAAPSVDRDVLPYYSRSADKSQSMRQMQILYRAKRSAGQASADINKAIADYKSACAEEDKTFREESKMAMATERETKWAPLGELDGDGYFYDKTNVARSKEGVTMTVRRESYDFGKSFDTARAWLNCKKATARFSVVSRRDGQGIKLQETGGPVDGPEKKIVPGTVEELLSRKFCTRAPGK